MGEGGGMKPAGGEEGGDGSEERERKEKGGKEAKEAGIFRDQHNM